MSEPFLGELRLFAFNFAPKGWALCAGQFMAINQNQALFAILGTTYGGNGQTTFALPDLRGRTPVHFDSNHSQGLHAGEEAVTLTAAQMPLHTHSVNASASPATTDDPTNNFPASTAGTDVNAYSTTTSGALMTPSMIAPGGGSQPHENMPPFLVLNWSIALQGIFPSRS